MKLRVLGCEVYRGGEEKMEATTTKSLLPLRDKIFLAHYGKPSLLGMFDTRKAGFMLKGEEMIWALVR